MLSLFKKEPRNTQITAEMIKRELTLRIAESRGYNTEELQKTYSDLTVNLLPDKYDTALVINYQGIQQGTVFDDRMLDLSLDEFRKKYLQPLIDLIVPPIVLKGAINSGDKIRIKGLGVYEVELVERKVWE